MCRKISKEHICETNFLALGKWVNNMRMTETEMQKIVESANFIDDKGYRRKIENDTISFLGDGIDIIITYERYSDISDILIRFTKENEVYSVGWIACVRSGLSVKPHQRLENVLTLLSYVRENYSVIIDREYCKESDKLIEEFIANERRKKSQ